MRTHVFDHAVATTTQLSPAVVVVAVVGAAVFGVTVVGVAVVGATVVKGAVLGTAPAGFMCTLKRSEKLAIVLYPNSIDQSISLIACNTVSAINADVRDCKGP